MIKDQLFSWVQPICSKCLSRRPNTDMQVPDRNTGKVDTCSYCGRETKAGVYLFADPATVAYPQRREDA